MHVTYSSEMSDDFQLTKHHYVLEYKNHHTLTFGALVDDHR
jgi:hypothetical protein